MFTKNWAVLGLGLLVSVSSYAVSFDSNVPQDIQAQMVTDLAFAAQIQGQGQSKFHQQIFGAIDGAKYASFFTNHIGSIGMDGCGNGAAVACVKPWSGKKMFLTQNFVKFSHPQVARIMVVYHEARHTESENGNWAHDDCPVPFLDDAGKEKASIWTGAKLAGQPACDSTPFGSYGSSTIMLKNIALHCSNCSDKVKMDADLYATDQLGRINDKAVKDSMLNDFNGK